QGQNVHLCSSSHLRNQHSSLHLPDPLSPRYSFRTFPHLRLNAAFSCRGRVKPTRFASAPIDRELSSLCRSKSISIRRRWRNSLGEQFSRPRKASSSQRRDLPEASAICSTVIGFR